MPRLPRPVAVLMAAALVLATSASSLAATGAKPAAGKAASVASESAGGDFLATLDRPNDKKAADEEAPVYVTAAGFIARLALVLALAYLTILGLKRFTNLRSAVRPGTSCVRVLDTSMLGANRALHVVEIGSRKLVIGSTPSQVSLLTELAPEDVPGVVSFEPEGSFKDHLAAFLGSRPDTAKAAATVAEALRGSSAYLQDKVRGVSKLRGKPGGDSDA